MLIISNEEVRRLLTIDETIEALRISNREIAEFRDAAQFRLNRARTNHYLPWHGKGADAERMLAGAGSDARVVYNFKSMEGGSPHFGVWAVRSSSDLVRLASGPYGPTHTYVRYGDLPGNKGYSDLIFLYNAYDAQFEAIIQSAALQGMRVAATSALGTDYLCRRDVVRMGLFGSGWQAAANLRALRHVRPSLKQVSVFSPDAGHREAFAARMAAELSLEVTPVTSPEQAVRGMDLICEASSARAPVFDGAWLEPGQHIVSVGGGDEHFQRRPIDPKAVARCGFVAAHSLEVRYGLEEIDDCVAQGGLAWQDVLDLPDLVTGRMQRRPSGQDITFFKNNVGLGTQFAAVGGLVLQKAKAAGVGFNVPQEKVSQVMTR